jgi:hypothetical protein
VNDYNPLILLIWKANIDLQFIGEKAMVLNRYITGYITKSEKKATEAIWEECNKNKSLQSVLKSFAIQSLKNREIGSIEASQKLLGINLCQMDVHVKWLGAHMQNHRTRKLKKKDDIQQLNKESTDIYCNNIIDTYYPSRPKELDKICLYDFASYYDLNSNKLPCTKNKNHSDCIILNDNFGYMHKRKTPHLLKTPRYKPSNKEAREKYFHQLLILFKPWRDENNDLMMEQCKSYEESFKYLKEKNMLNIQLTTTFEDQKSRIEMAKQKIIELEKTPFEPICNRSEKENDETLGVNDANFYQSNIINEEQLKQKVNLLNTEQKKIYDFILQALDVQRNNQINENNQIKTFCSGYGGKYNFRFFN